MEMLSHNVGYCLVRKAMADEDGFFSRHRFVPTPRAKETRRRCRKAWSIENPTAYV
jgi:hypothetical protein